MDDFKPSARRDFITVDTEIPRGSNVFTQLAYKPLTVLRGQQIIMYDLTKFLKR